MDNLRRKMLIISILPCLCSQSLMAFEAITESKSLAEVRQEYENLKSGYIKASHCRQAISQKILTADCFEVFQSKPAILTLMNQLCSSPEINWDIGRALGLFSSFQASKECRMQARRQFGILIYRMQKDRPGEALSWLEQASRTFGKEFEIPNLYDDEYSGQKGQF